MPSPRNVFVGTPALNPAPGQQFEIKLFVDVGAGELGSYSFEFTYDPLVVNVVSITGGDSPEFSAPPVTNPGTFSSGTTPLAAIQSGPNTGFLSVATLTLEAVGGDGSQSVLDLTVLALFSGGGSPLPATVFASSVLIAEPAMVPLLSPIAILLLLTLVVAIGSRELLSRSAGAMI